MRRLILGLMIMAPALAGCGHSATLSRARQVAACEAAHQMSSAHQVTIRPTQWTAGVPSPEGSTLVQVCTWPPVGGADPDGYLRVTVDTVGGPGQAEYTGDTLLDNVHGPCAHYRLTYAQGYQGAHQTIVERVRAGVSEKLGVGPYPVGSEPVPYPDASGGVVITHNSEYELQDAVCDVPGATGLPAPAIHQETQQP